MSFKKFILKNFEHQKVLENLTKYELYYQIALVKYVRETEFDIKSSIKKIYSLKLFVRPQQIFRIILGILRKNYDESHLDYEYLDAEMKRHASLKALNDFIVVDKTFLNPEPYVNEKITEIKKNTLFTKLMNRQVKEEYSLVHSKWSYYITKDGSREIRHNMVELVK